MKIRITIIIYFFLLSNAYSQENLHLIATITGEKAGDEFGLIKKVGDVNGDGYDDLLVNSPRSEYVKLYFGGSPFDTVADFRFTGAGIGGAGDVNGDGFDDIALINYYPYYTQVKIYYGGTEFDTIPDISHPERYFSLYSSLTGVGDINNDGFDDYIISNVNMGTTCIGCSFNGSYLFLGGDSIKSSLYLTFNTKKIGDNFGASICSCDLNHDGFKDIIIGAPGENDGIDSGYVYIYYSGATMDTIADSILYRENVNGFGSNIQYAGDINNDGIDDMLIASSSSAYIYLGYDLTHIIKSVPNLGVGGNANIGVNGDINNDGFDDFLIGNTNYKNDNDVMVGIVQGYYGGAVLDTLYNFRMEGETKWGQFSKQITIVGDLNGDGYDEVCISAPGFPDYQNPLGKFYFYSYKEFNSIDDEYDKQPYGFMLNQNYPNPFNSQTKISYNLENVSSINIAVYNCTGKKIKILIFENQGPGSHSITWDGKNETGQVVSTGVYFMTMHAETLNMGEYKKTIKVLFIK